MRINPINKLYKMSTLGQLVIRSAQARLDPARATGS